MTINVKNEEGLKFLDSIEDKSIDLILTDPPYIISQDSGMNKHHNLTKELDKNNSFLKTEEEWKIFKQQTEEKHIKDHGKKYTKTEKENYLKYGTHLGKKYTTKTDYGEWDKNFTINNLENFIEKFYKKLKKGGTLIIWFDLWKIETLKNIMEKHKFKQLRFIEWIKTNPQPRNSKVNYLTNSREIALLGVKGGSPTFNSSYDNGIYNYPKPAEKSRIHPTQKSLPLFEELIKKHSNEGDMVLDTFLGGGTTMLACKNTNRNFTGCEVNKEYFDKINN